MPIQPSLSVLVLLFNALSRISASGVGLAAAIEASATGQEKALRAVRISSHGLMRREPVCKKVEPELQLRERYRIASYSNRQDADVAMIEEGIKDHPMLALEQDYAKADFVLWSLRGSGLEAEGSPPNGVPPHKLVVVDWSDGPTVLPYIPKSSYLATFKRSFVRKKDGVFKELASGCQSADCFPFGYAVLNQYIDGLNVASVGDSAVRTIPLLCSLRPWLPPTPEALQRQVGIARNRVLWWLNHDATLPANSLITGRNSSGTPNGLTAESWSSVLQLEEKDIMSPSKVGNSFKSTADIGPNYKGLLRNSFLTVTANPAIYEGDHRFWEHFASGNVVLSDHIFTPLPFPPIPGKHYEEFDVADRPGNNRTFLDKVHKLLKGGSDVETMACNGFQHALRHHRSVSRLDYIVRSLAEMVRNASYTETGMQLRKRDPIATLEEKAYEPADKPEYLIKIH